MENGVGNRIIQPGKESQEYKMKENKRRGTVMRDNKKQMS